MPKQDSEPCNDSINLALMKEFEDIFKKNLEVLSTFRALSLELKSKGSLPKARLLY